MRLIYVSKVWQRCEESRNKLRSSAVRRAQSNAASLVISVILLCCTVARQDELLPNLIIFFSFLVPICCSHLTSHLWFHRPTILTSSCCLCLSEYPVWFCSTALASHTIILSIPSNTSWLPQHSMQTYLLMLTRLFSDRILKTKQKKLIKSVQDSSFFPIVLSCISWSNYLSFHLYSRSGIITYFFYNSKQTLFSDPLSAPCSLRRILDDYPALNCSHDQDENFCSENMVLDGLTYYFIFLWPFVVTLWCHFAPIFSV